MNNKLIGISILSGLVLAGCTLNKMVKLAKQQQLAVSPNPLELHADSVKFDLSATLPLNMLKKNTQYALDVVYASKIERINVGTAVLNSKDYPNAKTENPKIVKKFSFYYKPELRVGDVLLKGTASSINNTKGKSTPELPVGKGIITTNLLVKEINPVAYADHGYDNREELQPTIVEFFFEKRISKLSKKEMKSNNAKFFEKFIASKYVTRTVNIVGTHSPEGAELVNTKLSEERAIEIEKFYKTMMKKFNYGTKADSITFVTKGKVQDWTEFKAAVTANIKLKEEQKAELIAIADGSEGTFRGKELEMEKLKSFKILEKEIYPKLRNARTEVLTVKPKKTDAEIFAIAQKLANGTAGPGDTLKQEEIMYAATLTPLSDEKEGIYKVATKVNPTWASHNNLGAVYLEKAVKEPNSDKKKELAAASAVQFDIARKKSENPTVLLNLASARLLIGDATGSAEALYKGLGLQPTGEVAKGLNGIKGVLDIKAANYPSAIQSLNNAGNLPTVLYDKSLALLLKKDFGQAKAGLDEVNNVDPNNAWGFYVAACNAARMNDLDGVTAKLKKAFALDPGLKAKALDDVEFIAYWNNEKFKDALK